VKYILKKILQISKLRNLMDFIVILQIVKYYFYMNYNVLYYYDSYNIYFIYIGIRYTLYKCFDYMIIITKPK